MEIYLCPAEEGIEFDARPVLAHDAIALFIVGCLLRLSIWRTKYEPWRKRSRTWVDS
jgi:hypothetical protein